MNGQRRMRVLLTVLLVLVPALVGVLAGSRPNAFALDSYTITPSVVGGLAGHGTISPDTAQTVADGATPTFTFSPAANYHVEAVTVDGSPVSMTGANAYTFPAVGADHAISVEFALDSYAITVTQTANGTISPGTTSVAHGGSQAFTITPDANYHIASVTVDGVARALTSPYTFTNVTATHTITATFALDTFTLTYNHGTGGTLSGETSQTVNYMASGTPVTAKPNTGYHFVSWSDGKTANPRTDANVTGNVSVTATFAIDTFRLTYTALANGTISGETSQTVNYNGSGSPVTAKPNTGYHFVSWSDGVATAARTDANVQADHSVTASFAINTYTITPSAGPNGSISPDTTQTVAYGAAQTFTIASATGYYIADVLVDGVSVGPVPGYTFTAVSADHTISASFAPGVQTRLQISAAMAVVDYGSSTLLTGVLYDSGDPLHEVGMGDRPVTVQSSSSATGPWADLETLTTSSVAGSVGACTLTVTPMGPTYYRLRFVAGTGSGYGGSLSFVVRVGVRPLLGTPKVPSSVRAGRSFTVYGTLSPQLPAGEKTVAIKVYRYRNRRWVFMRQVSATNADRGDGTRYGVKLKLTSKGKYRFRAFTAPTPTWAGDTTGLSTVLTVK